MENYALYGVTKIFFAIIFIYYFYNKNYYYFCEKHYIAKAPGKYCWY